MRIQDEASLLQQTVQRLIGIKNLQKPIIKTNEKHYFLSQEQLIELTEVTYLLEPQSKNTAPSIASCAHHLMAHSGPDAVMVIFP